MYSCLKSDSETFFINDVFGAKESFLSYSYKKCVGGNCFRLQFPDDFGFKLKPTGSCVVKVGVSESDS